MPFNMSSTLDKNAIQGCFLCFKLRVYRKHLIVPRIFSISKLSKRPQGQYKSVRK